jgi:hypothetical protein
MTFKKLAIAAAAVSLIATPVSARGTAARASAPVVEANELGGEKLIAGLFALLVFAAFLVAGDDSPASP